MPRATPPQGDIQNDDSALEHEVDQRMEEVRPGEVETIPAEQVFAEIDLMLEQRAKNSSRRP